jgi:hypothetical protein
MTNDRLAYHLTFCLQVVEKYFFLVSLEIELRDLHLLGRHSITLAMTPALFVVLTFQIRVFHLCPG